MHYNPENNIVRRMQCTENIFTRWDVQGEDRLTPVKLDHSFTQQASTEAVLGARHCRLSKTSRIPHATDRSTRDIDITHGLQKTMTRVIKAMMKYRVLRLHKRKHLPCSEGQGRKWYVRSLGWGGGGYENQQDQTTHREHSSNALLCSQTCQAADLKTIACHINFQGKDCAHEPAWEPMQI